MWACWLVLGLFALAVACVGASIYKHDGPVWCGGFILLLCAAVAFW
jgi:hypothetical protein